MSGDTRLTARVAASTRPEGSYSRAGRGPAIYEINTAVWLAGHSLAEVPARRWDAIAALPVDAVWLMGVWQRSPAGLAIAASDEGLSSSFRQAVADLRPSDVIGSPYC